MTGLFMRKDNRRKKPGFGTVREKRKTNNRNQEEPGWKREAGTKAERRCWMK